MWVTNSVLGTETFLGSVFQVVIFFYECLWVLWQEAIYRGKPKKSCWCLLPNKISEAFLWVRSQGFSLHDVAEFLETDLGKRKLTYVGVTISVVSLWHPLLHNGFEKNGETPNRSWDLNTFWSEVLCDFGSSPLQVMITCISLVLLPVCFAVLFLSFFHPFWTQTNLTQVVIFRAVCKQSLNWSSTLSYYHAWQPRKLLWKHTSYIHGAHRGEKEGK